MPRLLAPSAALQPLSSSNVLSLRLLQCNLFSFMIPFASCFHLLFFLLPPAFHAHIGPCLSSSLSPLPHVSVLLAHHGSALLTLTEGSRVAEGRGLFPPLSPLSLPLPLLIVLLLSQPVSLIWRSFTDYPERAGHFSPTPAFIPLLLFPSPLELIPVPKRCGVSVYKIQFSHCLSLPSHLCQHRARSKEFFQPSNQIRQTSIVSTDYNIQHILLMETVILF